MGPEAKLYQNVKQNFKSFSLIRIENISLLGTPDLLVCNTSGNFCTIELKVTKGNKLQILVHIKLRSILSTHTTHLYLQRPLVLCPLKLLQYPCTMAQR
jgi:hypothetical protein